jgi:hypothetical protein
MYIDVDKASRRALIGKTRIYLNGKEVKYCIAAKHGRKGFVEYWTRPLRVRGDEIVRVKKRGNVKISFNLKGRYAESFSKEGRSRAK